MSRTTILIVDNDPSYLQSLAEALERERYRVVTAKKASEAKQAVKCGDIDVAILDMRLECEGDEKDTSGLTLAKEMPGSLPKIILTQYGSAETAIRALKVQEDGLPPAISFVEKKGGLDELSLIQKEIEDALSRGGPWLKAVAEALRGRDEQLEGDHRQARRQADVYSWVSLGVAVLGGLIVFASLAVAHTGRWGVDLARAASGIVTGTVGYLFFRRVDAANRQMNRYHKERQDLQWFTILLRSCEGLEPAQRRNRCREQVVLTAVGKFLGPVKGGKPVAARPIAKAGGGGE